MNKLRLELSVEMLLSLLRAAIHQQNIETDVFQQATDKDWVKCYLLATHQGVAAIVWESIERIPEKYAPPVNVKLSWAIYEKGQTEEYKKQCQAISSLTQLLAQHGISTVVLKGVGLSRLYPNPTHRVGGDIDIYTYSANRAAMTDDEANRLADEVVMQQGAIMDNSNSASTKHSRFSIYGATFENHKKFLFEAECQTIIKAEQWLKSNIQTHSVELLNGEYQIEVPTVGFDSVFVALHAAQHYGLGLSLKHLCDWALLRKQEGFTTPSELEDRYFKRTISTLTQLCDRYISPNTPSEQISDLANKMIQEIIYPPYYGKTPSGGFYKTRLFQLRNRIHIFRLKHRLLGVSFWGKIWRLWLRKIR